METKLFQPCRTTMTRCPKTKSSIAHMIRKCHNRAQWKPPIIQASHENWIGFQMASPVSTESTPSTTTVVNGEHGKHTEHNHGRVRMFLQRVVGFAHRRLRSEKEIVLHHRPDA